MPRALRYRTVRPNSILSRQADDIAIPTDAPETERFAVMGISGGDSCALARGARLPDRVMVVGVTSGGEKFFVHIELFPRIEHLCPDDAGKLESGGWSYATGEHGPTGTRG